MIELADIRQQADHDCGPTAVRVLMRALGRRLSLEQFLSLPCDPVDGTDPRAIETWLRGVKLRVLSGSMTWTDLVNLTASGRPVICLVTPLDVGHYVVVGSALHSQVHYQCPSEGPTVTTQFRWMRQWREVDRLGAAYHQWGITAWRP